MSANQVSIPYTQTSSPELNLIQQYVNKVFKNFDNKVTGLQTDVSDIQGLGDIILSPLTLNQFQAIHSDNWIAANGQSSVGTAYETLTGKKTVPTISVSGTNAYIKVN